MRGAHATQLRGAMVALAFAIVSACSDSLVFTESELEARARYSAVAVGTPEEALRSSLGDAPIVMRANGVPELRDRSLEGSQWRYFLPDREIRGELWIYAEGTVYAYFFIDERGIVEHAHVVVS